MDRAIQARGSTLFGVLESNEPDTVAPSVSDTD